MANSFTIGGLNQALVTQLSNEPETSVSTSGNVSIVTGHGISATAAFDPAAGALTVTVTEKPWYVPVSLIESKLRQGVDEVRR